MGLTKNNSIQSNHTGGEQCKEKIKHWVKDNVVVFNTRSDTAYSIVPNGQEMAKSTIYKGNQNNAPKHFLKATLGKAKNF